MKRLSKVMKARQNESGGGGSGEVKTESEVKLAVSIHVDEKTRRRYSCNEATGQTQWLSDDGEEDGTIIEEQGERKARNTKRPLFRQCMSDDDEVYYENMETGEAVWKIPDNGDLVES